jgi:hypothetical protein
MSSSDFAIKAVLLLLLPSLSTDLTLLFIYTTFLCLDFSAYLILAEVVNRVEDQFHSIDFADSVFLLALSL